MSEAVKCPKCGGEMKMGKLLARYSPIKNIMIWFSRIREEKVVDGKEVACSVRM